MGPFCEYADVLGKPGEGFHKARLGPFAAGDLIATIILAIIIALIWQINIFATFSLVFGLGVLMHWAFCVDTAFMRMLSGT